MSLFKHPHLVRGIVHTPHGAFTIVRGVVDLPDEIGDALGWDRAESPAGDPAGLSANVAQPSGGAHLER